MFYLYGLWASGRIAS